jgi:hypothetical protein
MIKCPKCGADVVKNGKIKGKQQYYCKGVKKHYFEDKTTKKMEVTKSLSVEAFREQFDNQYKIQQGVKKLNTGELVLHRDFKEMLGLQGSPSSEIFDMEEFDQYKGKAPGGKVFWSHPSTIKALKDDPQRLLK